MSGEQDDASGIRQPLRDSLEWFKVPEHVHVVGELPRTLNGKTDRAKLRAIASSFDALR
jgi:acyl-coenzyme A synthetase/AMP-(fatty) acid ligase